MKITIRLVTLLVLLSLFLVPMNSVHAQGSNPDGGQVIFGSNFTLESGETFDGDLVVFGGNVTIEKGASLKGDLVVIGGRIECSGETEGDVVVVGGQVKLNSEAVVAGDVVAVGGQIDRAEGARVGGDVVNNVAPNIEIPNGRVPPGVPDVQVPTIVDVGFNPFWEFGKSFGAAVLAALLGVLATLFFQDRLGRVSQAVVDQPLVVGGIGLLSLVVAVALVLTVIPVIALAFAWLFGMIAIGQEIGERFSKSIRQDWTPAITSGVGTFILVFLVSSIQAVNNVAWFVGCVTWIIPFSIGLLAVGAVVLTRFGARPVQSPVMTAYIPPIDPSSGSGQIPPAS